MTVKGVRRENMKKFEYRIFNFSEAAKDGKGWFQRLNELGAEGWEFKTQLKETSFLLIRETR
jgi:hypothetical protein